MSAEGGGMVEDQGANNLNTADKMLRYFVPNPTLHFFFCLIYYFFYSHSKSCCCSFFLRRAYMQVYYDDHFNQNLNKLIHRLSTKYVKESLFITSINKQKLFLFTGFMNKNYHLSQYILHLSTK